ncbi:phage tail tape measure protein [Tenacibaculum sp. SZ-18]|uniref:phage tail tape measure protein n=1 Tax=Tenacibaculum sp. SZ-18 TaxID=754423 RepID=UPI000C2D4CB6|nr:phage tail tape measure protein [Tenacibaculum sp. SZ-18]AUC15410.1 phage tail tape measure protein [Tenacibaculum sp. SZ-18]
MSKGKISFSDSIDEKIFQIGNDLAKSLQPGIDKVEQLKGVFDALKSSALAQSEIEKQFKISKTRKDFLEIKKKEAQVSQISLKAKMQEEKLRQTIINTEKKEIELANKKEAVQRRNNKLTLEEKVQNQALNRIKRLQIREQLGLVDAYEKLNRKRTEAQRKLKNLLSSEKLNERQIRRARAEYEKLNNRISKVDNATDEFSKNIGNYSSSLNSLKGLLASIATNFGLIGGSFAFIQVMRNGLKIIRDFEKQNATLAGVLQVEKEELNDLRDSARELGETTVKTAGEVTTLQIAYARLGFSQKEILDLTESTIQGSIALNSNLESTAKLTGAVVNTFDDLSTTDAPKILDVLSLATAKSALDFEKLETGIPIVAGAANSAGIPFTKLVALMGKLSDAGIDVSTSSTALRNIFIESAAQGLNYEQILEKIKGSQDKLTASNDEYGKRAAVSASILANNIDQTKELDLALQNAGGTAEGMANKELDTLDGALQLLKSAWQGIILENDKATGTSNVLKEAIQFLANNLKLIVKVITTATGLWLAYKGAIVAVTIAKRLATSFTVAYRIAIVALNRGLIPTIKNLKLFRVALSNPVIAAAVVTISAIVIAFRKMSSEMTIAERKTKLLNNARKEAKKAISNEKASIDTLINTAKNENLSKEQRLKAILDLNSISPEYLGNITLENINTENTTKAIKSYIKELDKKALAQALAEKKQELYQKLIDAESKSIEDNVKWYENVTNLVLSLGDARKAAGKSVKDGIQNRNNEISGIKEEIKAIDSLIKKKTESGEISIGGRKTKDQKSNKVTNPDDNKRRLEREAYELAKFRIEKEIELQQEIVKNEEKTSLERFDSIKTRVEAEKKLAELKKEYLLSNEKLTANGKLLIEEQYQNDLDSIRNREDESLVDLEVEKEKRKAERLKDEQEKALNDKLKSEHEAFSKRQGVYENEENLVELREKRIAEIKKDYAKKALDFQIQAIETLLNNEQLSAEKRAKYERKLSKIKLEVAKISYEDFIEKSDGEVKKTADKVDKILNISSQLNSGISELSNSLFGTTISNIDAEIEKNDEKFSKQLENESLSEQNKKLIEDKREKEKQKLEKKRRAEERKQAVFNKLSAAAQAGINIGLGITKALAQGGFILGIPQAAIVASLGAIQLASILSQPIPKYKHGRKGGPAEFAEVGDGYVHEVVEKKNGEFYITPNTPTLTYLEEDDKVHSNMDDFIKSRTPKQYEELFRKGKLRSIDQNGKRAMDHNRLVVVKNDLNERLLTKVIKDASKSTEQSVLRAINKSLLGTKIHGVVNIESNDLYNKF